MTERLCTVLFDLDGTLADTAPDLAFALNTVLAEQGHPPLPLATIRPVVSLGSPGLLKLGFGLTPEDAVFPALRQRLLAIYLTNLVRETQLFPGTHELLACVEQRGLNWGIVTNKPALFTLPLIEQLGLTQRAACIVSGDTTPHSKPHPAPLLHACREIGSTPAQCLYIGDAQCDIEAGKRAGMRTLIASFGYIAEQERPETWGANGMVAHPMAILDWIKQLEPADSVFAN